MCWTSSCTGQTRILFAMSREVLVPASLSKVDAESGSPRINTLVVSGFVAILAAFIPSGKLADATSIGTLFAFGLVNVAVLLLRRRRPDRPRSFRVPLSPVTPILGVLCCAYMMLSLDAPPGWSFRGWLAVGLLIYWTWSNVLTSIQQYVMMRRFKVDNPIDRTIARLTGRKASPG